MDSKTYDFLKRIILPILSGSSAFILTVGEAWNIPQYKALSITFSAGATFLTYFLNESSKKYLEDKDIIPKDSSVEVKG